MARRRNVREEYSHEYSKLVDASEVDGFVDERFVPTPIPEPTPWKTIAFVIVLFIIGVACLTMSITYSTTNGLDDRASCYLIIGALAFIPGGYYGFILMCILCRLKGYTMNDIPKL